MEHRGQVKTDAVDRAKPRNNAANFAAALEWWADAGVDCAFADAPQPWLAAETVGTASVSATGGAEQPDAPVKPAPPSPSLSGDSPTIGGVRAGWPDNLAAFQNWWLTEPSLDGGRITGRVPPRGIAAAPLMILIEQPDSGDTTQLLGGAQGRLLDMMLHAMGLSPADTYVASALPRHTPAADLSGFAAAGLGAVVAHHVALVGPKHLIAFGAGVLSLLGHDPAHNADVSRDVNQDSLNTGLRPPILAARDLAVLLTRPMARAGFWQAWLDWTESDNR